MPRHCKNANSKTFLTANERKKNALGSLKMVYGSDSAKPFDSCCICLHRVINPMSCDQGHLFCKKCIFNFIVEKEADYEEQLRQYEIDITKKQIKEKQEQLKDTEKILESIDTTKIDHTNSDTTLFANKVYSKEEIEKQNQLKVIEKFSSKTDLRTEDEKKLHVLFMETDPEHIQTIKKPSSIINCPAQDHPIKLKDLITIHFDEHEEDNKKVFYCPSCLKTYNFQKVMLIKKCGHTLCYDCFKQFVSTSKQCFTCSNPVTKKKDFLQLQSGETGFASHNTIEATLYKPGKN